MDWYKTKFPFSCFLAFSIILTSCVTSDKDSDKPDDPGFEKMLALLKLDGSEVLLSEVIRNLSEPWEITWGPDDHIWFTEHQGFVSRLNPQSGERKVILQVTDVHYEKSRGLLSMVLHPDFDEEPFVYLHYTYIDSSVTSNENIRSKLVRYLYQSGQDTLINGETILTNIPGKTYHNGSRMIVTSDKKILLSTGDAGNPSGSQDENLISGKMLRLNLDGTVPHDNPRSGSYVYSIGHRNAQGLVSANGRIYSSEHGPQNDDEINLIEAGNNYGWPNVEGFCDKENELKFCESNEVNEPLISWSPTIAPAGLDYYNHPSIPEWQNSLLLTTLKGRSFRILRLDESGEKIVNERIYFQKIFGRIRDLCISPQGDIYLVTSNTDWHPRAQAWMYDELPTVGYDKIIKLSALGTRSSLSDTISILKEDSVQMPLFSENWNIPIDINDPGGRLYLQNCAICHMPDGKGIAGSTPPLVNTDWVKGDKKRLISLTLKGLSEEIEVNGIKYNQEMPGFAASLNDSDIATLLSFIRTNFDNDAQEIKTNEVLDIREQY